VADDLLRDPPRARGRALRQDGRVLQGQSGRHRDRGPAGGTRPAGGSHGRRQARDPRPPPGADSGHLPEYGSLVARLAPVAAATGTREFRNYVDGEWVDAAGGETFESFGPATGETIGVFPKSGPEDVDRAVEAARAAFEEWRLVPAPRRGEILFRFGRLLIEHKEDISQLMTREM